MFRKYIKSHVVFRRSVRVQKYERTTDQLTKPTNGLTGVGAYRWKSKATMMSKYLQIPDANLLTKAMEHYLKVPKIYDFINNNFPMKSISLCQNNKVSNTMSMIDDSHVVHLSSDLKLYGTFVNGA